MINNQRRDLSYLPKPKVDMCITLIRGLIIHDNMRKPDSIIVLQYIFKQSAEENTTQVRGLETRKTLNTKLVL